MRFGIDVLAAVLGVLTALLVVTSRWPIARRIAELQGAERSALVQRVETAEALAKIAGSKLRRLTAEATIVVAGDWSAPLEPGGHTPLGLPQEDAYVVLTGGDSGDAAQFFPTYLKRFNDADGTARVVFRAAVRDGEWPLGESSEVLRGLRPTGLALPMFQAGDTRTGKATIVNLQLSISADGEKVYEFQRALGIEAILPKTGWVLGETNLPALG